MARFNTRAPKAARPASPVTTTGYTRTHLGGKGYVRELAG